MKRQREIAAVIIEPIQAEGGDRHASAWFFKQLRKITKENNVLMIVDEVQTGVAITGKFWAFEHWNLDRDDQPDIVTFSKKMQLAGCYFGPELRPLHSYRNFNTWMGDPVRLLQANFIINEIEKQDLINRVVETGNYLTSKLEDLANISVIENVRGQGLFIAFDLPSVKQRDDVVFNLRQYGVNTGGCGERSVRLRPMLIFDKDHAGVFLGILQRVLNKLAF